MCLFLVVQRILVDTYYEVSGTVKKNGEQKTFGKGEGIWDVLLRAVVQDEGWQRVDETAENLRKTFRRYEKAFQEVHGKVKKMCRPASGDGGEKVIPPEAKRLMEKCKCYEVFAKWAEVRGHLSPSYLIESGDGGEGAAAKGPDKRKVLKDAARYVLV